MQIDIINSTLIIDIFVKSNLILRIAHISLDRIYLNIDNKDKYAFITMDFSSSKIIYIVHNCYVQSLKTIFSSISMKERLNVKGVISNVYKIYLKTSEDIQLQHWTVFMSSSSSFLKSRLYKSTQAIIRNMVT